MTNTPIPTKLLTVWQKRPRRLAAVWHPRFPASQLGSVARMVDESIEEELLPGDRLACFHPTRPGEVLDGRFKTIAKLGYGAGSTVWLAENLEL